VHFLLGEALLAQARPAEAYAYYDQGILIGPDHPEYRHAAATIAATIGKYDDAEIHYRAAQRLDPANPKYPLYLAQVQRKQGDADAARASLVMATKIDPDLAIAWGTLAAIAMDEGRLPMAEHYLERAVALEPDRTEWRVMRARVLRRQNQPQEGATLLLALPESVRSADKGVILELATCYGMLSRPKDAADLYTAAVATFPNDPEMAYQAALWLDRADERERAMTFAAMAAAQGHEGAKKMVERE
jgi:tetratricopeptide (TPR) repeat protein